MTVTAEAKQRTHGSILASAVRLLREKGISGARVADVMRGAGLTVGGFYAHFASKDALIDETLGQAASEQRVRLFDKLDDKPLAARAQLLFERYVSTTHRDDVSHGCPLPAVVGEVAVTGEHTQPLAATIDRFASRLEPHLEERTSITRRHRALAMIALMYGGLTLARALRGTPLSDDVLRACRAFARQLDE